jgi:hypothetical protein
MRLFRQPRFGAWDDVVQRVCCALSERIAGPRVLRQDVLQDSSIRTDMKVSGTHSSPPRQEAGNLHI